MQDNKVLQRMLDRLYGAMGSGPAINCRPHHSRQRIDLATVAALDGTSPTAMVAALLGEGAETKVRAPVSMPPPRERSGSDAGEGEEEVSPERRAWLQQQAVLNKLRSIADDARTYLHDTGAHALQLGFPLLHVPAGNGSTRKILAPIAFVPLELTVKSGRIQGVEIGCAGKGADRLTPNVALLAWIERQTGKKLTDLFADEEGAEPWRELRELCEAVAKAIDLANPLVPDENIEVVPVRKDDGDRTEILPSGVIGLFPAASLGLVRDTEGLLDGTIPAEGPVSSFLRAGAGLGSSEARGGPERLISSSDPCQARAVRLARVAKGLVIHGPPGTGKSQTITNVIGDHLARGERVLFVCDKRTALDVVHDRLEHLGLGQLCAVIHDPQRDQRDLYMGIREQLDALPEATTFRRAEAELETIEREMGGLHDELSRHHEVVSGAGAGPSLHELVGAWLAEPEGPEFGGVKLDGLRDHDRDIRELFERAEQSWLDNQWRDALGIDLERFLGRPMAAWREAFGRVEALASELDDAPCELPFGDGDPVQLGDARASMGARIEQTLRIAGPEVLRWAADGEGMRRSQGLLAGVADDAEAIRTSPLEPRLAALKDAFPSAEIPVSLARLRTWQPVAGKWYSFCFSGRRKLARPILERLGLALDADSCDRAIRFLEGLQARFALSTAEQAALSLPAGASLPDDRELVDRYDANRAAFQLLDDLVGPDAEWLRRLLPTPTAHGAIVATLLGAQVRGRAIAAFERAGAAAELFDPSWLGRISVEVRAGGTIAPLFASLSRRFGDIEGLLRMRRLFSALPPGLSSATAKLIEDRCGSERALSLLRRSGLADEIRDRIRRNPELSSLDGARIESAHRRFRELQAGKQEAVRKSVLHCWTSRQQQRLLATTGSRLNGAGTEVRRRLMLRGDRAMKVRQVIASGATIEGGDPIFDLRPVWMASPQTVAQIFPPAPLFDVVVFDEASQCRLEEALPVLLRARRVVIAGDPKQLPPSRFFEAGLVASESDADLESEQGLFEEQQSDVEDLLGAALNLEIEQAYLDVHYRSTNADLIEFSNRSFYESRLQAIPGHPRNRARIPPIQLVQVSGVYEKRQNRTEALAVVATVKKLLAGETPPSIGIACFNLSQRDLIQETLEEAALQDPGFAAQLAAARSRRGAGSFEGLFVKNLENVQGDERDHMIISTTYGPDAKGRFYRRFGPLGMPGGGRRLNVLVTRARKAVHLVTSIPPEIYRSLPALESGRQPNGGWLLFSYLNFAEMLATAYVEGAPEDRVEAAPPTLLVHEARHPSQLAEAIAARIVASGRTTEVHWGNDGFCVDVAHHPPDRPDAVEGVLCDGSRFAKSEDAVEWDLFRTAILEGQGWTLRRI